MPFVVDRHRHEPRASAAPAPRARPDSPALRCRPCCRDPRSDSAADLQRHLRAGHDQHLIGLATDRARGAEIVGHGLAQRHIAGRIAVGHLLDRELPGVLRHQLRPEPHRKAVQRGKAHAQRPEARRSRARDACAFLLKLRRCTCCGLASSSGIESFTYVPEPARPST